MTILTITRRLGHEVAIDRLLHIPPPSAGGAMMNDSPLPNTPHGPRSRSDPNRGER